MNVSYTSEYHSQYHTENKEKYKNIIRTIIKIIDKKRFLWSMSEKLSNIQKDLKRKFITKN